MSVAQLISSDDRSFPCTMCGSADVKIIRPDKENPRLRCSECNFVFNGMDSMAATQADKIGTSSAATLAAAEEAEVLEHESDLETTVRYLNNLTTGETSVKRPATATATKPPRSPAYVFLSKDRTNMEFCTKTQLKKTVMRWELQGKYDVFELSPKHFQVKVNA